MNTKRKPAAQTNRISFIIILLCIVSLFSFSGNAYAGDQSSKATSLTYQGITKVANEKKGVRITWPKTSLGSGYKIYRKTGSGSWNCIKTISNRTTVSYLDTSVENGKMYYYTVRAYLGILLSDYNKTGLAVFRLRTPYGINKCVSNAKGQITLAWDKNGAATGYQIAYSTNSGFSGMSKTKVSKNSATLKNLTPGKKYYVKVQPYKTYNGKNYFGGFSSAKNAVVGSGTSGNGSGNGSTYVTSSGTNENQSLKQTVFFTYRSDGLIDTAKVESYFKTTKTSNTTLLRFEYNNKKQLTGIYIKYYNSSLYKKVYTLSYDNDGNVKAVNKIGLQYLSGRLATASYSKYKVERFVYNSNGQLIQFIDASGGTEDLTWDAKNNRLTKRYSIRGTSSFYQFQNTYNNNLLTKQTKSYLGKIYDTWLYNYIPITISLSEKDRIEKQQWAIRNGDYYYTLGRNELVTAE